MRKAINISALVFFVWLLLDALNIPNSLLYFLLVGELPGTNMSLSPSIMLAITTLLIGIVLFEAGARRIDVIRRLRRQAIAMMTRRQQLPRRRFNQV